MELWKEVGAAGVVVELGTGSEIHTIHETSPICLAKFIVTS
jgi:hypothetical protein